MKDIDAMALLRAEVERTNISRTADRLGVSRAAISLLLSGKYKASPQAMYRRIIEVLGTVQCPYLGMEIQRDVCDRWRLRQRPPAQSAEAIQHWRACQTCPQHTKER